VINKPDLGSIRGCIQSQTNAMCGWTRSGCGRQSEKNDQPKQRKRLKERKLSRKKEKPDAEEFHRRREKS
jgi:hypothetical protein